MTEQSAIQVYFNLRHSSRERMWDTAREAAQVCTPCMPPIAAQSSVARAETKRGLRTRVRKRARAAAVRYLPLLNKQSVPSDTPVDLLYMWGAFPRGGGDRPFVIEMDNPYVLSRYNARTFQLRQSAIISGLNRAAHLTYLSTAARNHTLSLVGEAFAEKSTVFPPFMSRSYQNNRRPNDGLTRFLFVGLDFRRKGGPELLQAFTKLADANARLTVVSRVPPELKAAYGTDARITFLPPQPREVLFGEIYPQSDVFVFPSLHESLGVVVLEALSYGMGLIATDVYATPEMVRDGYNGQLLTHPILEPRVFNGVPTVDCVTMSSKQFSRQYLQSDAVYQSLVDELAAAMAAAMVKTSAWQSASVEHFERVYAPERWVERLQHILTAARHNSSA